MRARPDRPLLAAVTGTNGKTSVTTFLHQLFAAVGWSGASYTSHGVRSPDGTLRPVTVDNTIDFLPALIDQERAKGAEIVALEAFAAALAIGLYTEVEVDAAVCTGIESDHLDFHGTPEAYLADKLKLFAQVVRDDGFVVIPVGGAACDVVAEIADHRGLRLLRVGDGGDVALVDRAAADGSLTGTLVVGGRAVGEARLPFTDDIAVQNALLAGTTVMGLGAGIDVVRAGLAMLQPPAGRLEHVVTFDGIEVVVDTAHNPGALRVALTAARTRTPGRVIVVFGAGGDRDAPKRPEMGAVAAALADIVVLTDDNPRHESPRSIRAAVRQGCPSAIEIPNRIDAIHAALRMARRDDVVLVAGRGDERVQEIDDTEFAVDDREVVRSLVSTFGPEVAPDDV